MVSVKPIGLRLRLPFKSSKGYHTMRCSSAVRLGRKENEVATAELFSPEPASAASLGKEIDIMEG